MGRFSNTEEFIQKAVLVHGHAFSYADVVYTSATSKVYILCNTCEVKFAQQPNNHLSGQGCPNCCDKIRTKEDLQKSVKHLPYIFDFTNYVNRNSLIPIYCNVHSTTEYKTVNHIAARKTYCTKCVYQKREDQRILKNSKMLLKKAVEVHGQKYDYTHVKYVQSILPVNIKCNTCKIIFQQPLHNHCRGNGCPICGGNSQGWGPERYKGKPAIFYVLKLADNLYKIGITSRSLAVRYKQEKYPYEVLFQVSFLEGEDAWTTEKTLLCKLAPYKYKGKNILTTTGTREILTCDPLPALFTYLQEV